MKLLITIPTKSAPEYLARAAVCESTWLRGSPVPYKFFRDSELGLDESDPLVRQKRMKGMCRYALDHGYDYLFRVDSDAYVRVPALLRSDFQNHDYMGWCLHYTGPMARNRTAHGGAGFFLSRRAMELVVDAPHFPHSDGYHWGDIYTGQLLFDHGIGCFADRRFVDDIFTVTPLPENWITLHPLTLDEMRATK